MTGLSNQMKICIFLMLLFFSKTILFPTVLAEEAQYEVFSYSEIQEKIKEIEVFLKYHLGSMECVSEDICTFSNEQDVYDRMFFKIDTNGIYNMETERYLIVRNEDHVAFILELEELFTTVYCKADSEIVEFRKYVCVDDMEGKCVYGEICLSYTKNMFDKSWEPYRIVMPNKAIYWYISFIPYE